VTKERKGEKATYFKNFSIATKKDEQKGYQGKAGLKIRPSRIQGP